MDSLRKHLVEAYGGFADRRHTDHRQDHAIAIDGKCNSDVHTKFCSLIVNVPKDESGTISIVLYKLPLDDAVLKLIERHGNRVKLDGVVGIADLTLALHVHEIGIVEKFAKAIRRIVGRGRRYSDPNWKWIYPRTADSLDRFVELVNQFRASGQPIPPMPRPTQAKTRSGKAPAALPPGVLPPKHPDRPGPAQPERSRLRRHKSK